MIFSRRTSPRAALCAASLALLACDEDPAAIVLAFSSELPAPSSADSLSISVRREGEETFASSYDLSTRRALPGTLVLRPSDLDDARPVSVVSRLFKKGQTSPSITREVKLRFVSKRKPLVRLRFSLACVDKVCDPGLTCDRGACVDPSLDPDALPDASDNDDALSPQGCFSEERCLDALSPIQGISTCSFEAPAGSFNLAASWTIAPQHPVVLRKGSDWTSSGSSVSLSPFVCEALRIGSISALSSAPTSASCPLAERDTVICSPIPSGAGGQGGTAGAAGTAGAGQGGAGQGGAGQGGAGQGGAGQGGAGQGGAGQGGAGQGGAGAGQGGEGGAGASGQSGAGSGGAPPVGAVGITMGHRNTCAWQQKPGGGRLACWGASVGDLRGVVPGAPGDYEPSPSLILDAAKAPLENVLAATLGADDHACALVAGGDVYCWGNATSYCNGASCGGVPTKVAGLTGITAMIGLDDGNCALDGSGSVRCWGTNSNGTSGPLALGEVSSPALVPLPKKARAIFGDRLGCSILEDDSVWCWGFGLAAPAQISGFSGMPRWVTSSFYGAVAVLTENGSIWIAPFFEDPLGWGAAVERGSVPGGVEIAAYNSAILALDGAGKVTRGIVSGDALALDEAVPLPFAASTIAIGDDGYYRSSFCAASASGEVACWGANKYGELGNDKADSSKLPQELSPAGFEPSAGLLVSNERTLLSVKGGQLFTCGERLWLDGPETRVATLAPWTTLQSGITGVFPSDLGSLYVRTAQGVRLFSATMVGGSPVGELLAPPFALGAVQPPLGSLEIAQVISKDVFDWVVVDGRLFAHLKNAKAFELPIFGKPAPLSGVAPGALIEVEGLGGPVSELSTGNLLYGSDMQCARIADGTVRCWGNNTFGQCGVDPQGQSSVVVAPNPIEVSGIVELATTALSACALDGAGVVWCWGDNRAGQLGRKTADAIDFKAAPVEGLPAKVEGLACGAYHCCAWQGAAAHCWGSNEFAELGADPAAPFHPGSSSAPRLVELPASISAMGLEGRGSTSCAQLVDGRVFCWGQSYFGEACNGKAGSDVPPGLVTLPF